MAKNVAQKGFIQIQMQTHTRRRETFDPSTFEIIHIMDFNTLILSTMSIERHLFCFTLFCFFKVDFRESMHVSGIHKVIKPFGKDF